MAFQRQISVSLLALVPAVLGHGCGTARIPGSDVSADAAQSAEPDSALPSIDAALPATCEDGVFVRGELCFGSLALVNGRDVVYDARLGQASGESTLDIVYVHSDQVQTHEGDGVGGFAATAIDGATVFGQRVEMADLNRDALSDLLVVSAFEPTATILLGDGTGAFPQGSTVTLTGPATALALGQLNGDATADLILGTASAIQLLMGDSTGTLQPAGGASTGAPVTGLAAADFDGDSLTDIAVALGAGTSSDDTRIRIYRGDGNGGVDNFLTAPGNSAAALASGDFDGDAVFDLAYVVSERNELAIMYGAGAAAFSDPVTFATAAQPRYLAAADLTGDGLDDLVVGHAGEQKIHIYPAVGQGELGMFVSIPISAEISALHIDGDANGDTIPDIIVSSANAQIALVVLSTP